MKQCPGCQTRKKNSQFHKSRNKPDGLQTHCKDCRRKKQYGLRKNQYQQMVKQQNGKCAICHTKPDHPLRVDHDHTTGKVRQLLCHGCNVALGVFADNITRLATAIQYLHHHQQ